MLNLPTHEEVAAAATRIDGYPCERSSGTGSIRL